MRFIFRRTTAAKNDTNTAIAAQYGSNLTGWTNAVHQGTGPTEITITEETNGFGAGIDRVTVALPANLAGGGKLFVRLNVAVARNEIPAWNSPGFKDLRPRGGLVHLVSKNVSRVVRD